MTRFSGMILALLMTASAARFAEAQQPPSPSQSQPPASAQSQAQAHEWTPQGIEDLRESAASKTEFTLDHSMLVFASKLEPDEDLRRVIAGVSGISVHNYRFARNWQFDVAAVDSVNDEYRTAGWKQLMNEREKNGPGETDLWIRFENNAISNVAILAARSSEIDFFVVSGSISPMDLLHLGGHFGIPKIEGGVTVPNTTTRRP